MGLLTVPKSYTPRHNGKKYPKEKPYLLSAKEVRGVLAATDGKANKTPYKGVKSLFMETTGGVKGGTTGIGTKSGGGSTAGKTGTGDRGTPGMNQGSNGFKGGQGSQGSNGGTGQRGTPGMNQGSNAFSGGGGQGTDSRTSAMNSYNSMFNSQPGGRTPSDAQLSRTLGGILGSGGGISTPNASGSPYNNPASINVTPGNGSLQNAMTQRQAVNAMAPQAQQPNASMLANQYSQYRGVPPDVEDLTRAAYDRSRASQPLQAATGQPYGMQSPSVGLQAPAPQQQNSGIYNRALSDSQLGNPQMGNPNNAGYRAAVTASEALGGPASTQADNVYKALGFDDNQRAAMLGRNAVESANFAPSVFNGTRLGDAGTAYGLGQWRGDRIGPVKDFIGGIQADQSSPAAQAAAVVNEMQFREKPSYRALNAAQSLPQAMTAMNMFERPGRIDRSKPVSDANTIGYNDAMNYGQSYLSNPPSQQPSATQVASINPAMGPPTAQQQPPSQPFNWSSLPGAGMVKAAYNAVDQNVIQPTQEQVAKYGGFERAGKLAQIAVAISKFMPGGKGAPLGPGGQDRRGGGPVQNNGNQQPVTTPATPAPPPTVNPAAPQWYYPQYTQNWANLPTGAGGPIWHPSPPADGIFDVKPADQKKKKPPPPRGMLA